MGKSTSTIQYSVPISKKIPGETQIYRSPIFKDQLISGPEPGINDMKKAMISSFTKHSKNKCLGKIIRKQGENPFIEYSSYQQILNKAVQIGSAIISQNLAFQPKGQNIRLVGIFSKNRKQWTIVDLACILFKVVTVPLYDTLGQQNISHVLESTQISTIFVNQGSLQNLMKRKQFNNLKNIICLDNYTEQQQKLFKAQGISLKSFNDIAQIGKQNLIDYNSQQFKVSPKDCLTFSYTSGTTGVPKGVMLSHQNFTSILAAVALNKDGNLTDKDSSLSFLPLPHVLQRQYVYVVLFAGGSVTYFSGDIQKIKDDLQLVKPTLFVGVPLLYNRFYDGINKKLKQLKQPIKSIFNSSLNKKLANVTKQGNFTHNFYDKIFFKKTKQVLGGNVRIMVSGSAPLLSEVNSFMKVTMSSPMLEGYGQTESTGACFITASEDPTAGHVGGPVSCSQFKLVDIPEMRYTSEDKDENGNPMPRGQIWLRGPGIFLGYYKEQKKTKQALTQDGWLKTGDVGAILPSNNALKIIDRKKNIFKLSQGQYVASQKVESVYMDYPLLRQIYLYGDSSQSYAIVIVVLHNHLAEQKAKTLGITYNSFPQLCKDKKFKTTILNQMNALGRKKGLKGFQIAKNIYIEPENFQTKQIVTNTLKVQRHEAKKCYKQVIQNLYKQGKLQQIKQGN